MKNKTIGAGKFKVPCVYGNQKITFRGISHDDASERADAYEKGFDNGWFREKANYYPYDINTVDQKDLQYYHLGHYEGALYNLVSPHPKTGEPAENSVLKEYQSFLAHKPTFHGATLEEAMARGDAYEKGWADGYWRYREGCVYGIDSVSEQCAQDYNDGFNEALVRFAKDEAEKKAEEEAAKEKGSKEIFRTAPIADHDPVNAPSYYRSHPSGVECIQITEHMGFNLGNALKYLWRNGLKEGNSAVRDLEKAIWYLQREIDRLGRVG